MGTAGLGVTILVVALSFSRSLSQDIDDIIQFDDELDNNPHNPLEQEEENVVILAELKKPKWKDSLRKYDKNSDGKLSGNELLLAYPEIQSLMENDDNDPLWWFTPNVGMFVAVAIGVITLGFALFKMRTMMSSGDHGDGDRSIKHELNRQQWLNRLEGIHGNRTSSDGTSGKGGSGDQDLGESSDENERQHRLEMSCSSSTKSSPQTLDQNCSLSEEGNDSATGMPETGEEESSINLQKRKPEVARDIVTSKMARYQHLSAVRRHPGNQSPKIDHSVFQQLLPDEDDLEDISGDEIVGKTRKRRQRAGVSTGDLQEKVARDCDSTTGESEIIDTGKLAVETFAEKSEKISSEAVTKEEVPDTKQDNHFQELKESAEEKADSDFEELYLVMSPLKEKAGNISTELLDDSSDPKTVSSESSGFLSESKDFSTKSKDFSGKSKADDSQ